MTNKMELRVQFAASEEALEAIQSTCRAINELQDYGILEIDLVVRNDLLGDPWEIQVQMEKIT